MLDIRQKDWIDANFDICNAEGCENTGNTKRKMMGRAYGKTQKAKMRKKRRDA